jgi:hypothetical protein
MNTTLKEIISSVAPFIGSLIGGPLGGEAASALSSFLTGEYNASPESFVNAIKNATPDQLVALKQLDEKYKEKILSVQLAEHQLDNDDIASARNRNIQLHDKMPALLSILILTMFFSILLLFMLYPIRDSAKDIIQILIGSLAIWCGQAMNFYLGTTHGSATKTNLLANIANRENKK